VGGASNDKYFPWIGCHGGASDIGRRIRSKSTFMGQHAARIAEHNAGQIAQGDGPRGCYGRGRHSPKGDIRASTHRLEEDGSRDGQCGGPTGIAGRTVNHPNGDKIKSGCSSAELAAADAEKACRESIRALKPIAIIFAAIYFLIDAVFISLIKPLGKWLSKLPIFARIDDLIRSLGPYPTFALFAVPVIVLEPIKPVGLYFIAEGNVVDGAVLIAIGEIAKITIIERIFHAGRDKLMTIPAFAWCYERVMAFRAYLETLAVWQAMLKAVRAIKERGKTNIRIFQGLSQVVAASSRLARRWRVR
jgi:hypothetical protein